MGSAIGTIKGREVYVLFRITYSTQPKVRDSFYILGVYNTEKDCNRAMDSYIRHNTGTDISFSYFPSTLY